MDKEVEIIERQILKIRSEIFSCKRAIEELEKLSFVDATDKIVLSPCIELLHNHIEAKQFLLEKGEGYLDNTMKT